MGAYLQTISEIFPAKPLFKEDDFPDQTGRVHIVTGGNTGIGKATCEVLLRKNAKVYMGSRSEEKALAAIEDLKQKTGKQDIHFLKLDLGDLTTIKGTVNEFLSKENKLHELFNNAGVMAPPSGSKSTQGYELQLGTNVIGPFLLTKLLLPTMLETAKTTNESYNVVRVVNTSSNGHLMAPKGGFKWDAPSDIGKWPGYGQSKWCNVVHADELARRYGSSGISAQSLNPGVINSDLSRHMSTFERFTIKPIMQPPSLGCLTQLYAGLMPETGKPGNNGKYFIPWGREGVTRGDTQSTEVGEKLWNWLEKETAQYA